MGSQNLPQKTGYVLRVVIRAIHRSNLRMTLLYSNSPSPNITRVTLARHLTNC